MVHPADRRETLRGIPAQGENSRSARAAPSNSHREKARKRPPSLHRKPMEKVIKRPREIHCMDWNGTLLEIIYLTLE